MVFDIKQNIAWKAEINILMILKIDLKATGNILNDERWQKGLVIQIHHSSYIKIKRKII